MAGTRSSQASDSAARKAKREREKKREMIRSEIERQKKAKANVGHLQQQLQELDHMDTADDVNSGSSAQGSSTTDPAAATAASTLPEAPKPADGEPGSRSQDRDRDETGELCMRLTTVSIHEGTPVAYRLLRGGQIGLIMQLGPIQACTYELQKVGKGYRVDGLMAKEDLPKNGGTFHCLHGVLVYDGNRIDVKVRMLRPKEGSEGEAKSTVHWITRTNLSNFLPLPVALGVIQDVWNKQEQAYARIHPDHEIRPFPQLRARKSADTADHGQRI